MDSGRRSRLSQSALDVEVPDLFEGSSQVRLEEMFDGLDAWRRIPREHADIFARFEPHGQFEQCTVLDPLDGLQLPVSGQRREVLESGSTHPSEAATQAPSPAPIAT